MSAEIINLNKYRKASTKDEKQNKALENRRKHGRTKAEISIEVREETTSKKQLDGKQLDSDSSAEDHEKPV